MRTPSLIVVDDFLNNVDDVRALALQQEYVVDGGYKGRRTQQQFLDGDYKAHFEAFLGRTITRWEEYPMNGVFQFCTPEDPIVYHCDQQTHAAVIFLTPDAPPEAGTTLWRSRKTKASLFSADPEMFNGGFYDPTLWEKIDQVGNVYNRLVIWNGQNVHSASCYFGQHIENARLFQIFFFDAE